MEFNMEMQILEKEGQSGNLQSLFQSSLSLEIIYTILNGVCQQFQNPDQGMLLRHKKRDIKKIKSLANQTRNESHAYSNMDYYAEKIYLMKNQVLRNLDELGDSEQLLRRQNSVSSNSRESFKKTKLIEQELVTSLELKRKVIIK